MALPHYSALKIASAAGLTVATAFLAKVDPTVTVAVIGAITALLMALMNRNLKKGIAEVKETVVKIEINTDGTLKKLNDAASSLTAQLSKAKDELAHAQGRREGSEEERSKTEEKKS